MFIQNFEQLAKTPKRRLVLKLAEAAFEAAHAGKAVKRAIVVTENGEAMEIFGTKYCFSDYKRIICVAFGKAALASAQAVHELLGMRIECGFVLDVREGQVGNLSCRVGSHPYPTLVNIAATTDLLNLLKNLSRQDMVIMLTSGGGSSLLCMPHETSCDNETLIIKTLTKKGATIQELNTVRKHISKVKGGQLAKWCYPATIINLIISDVPGNDIGMVASGPTVKDTTSMHDAATILHRYDVLKTCKLASCNLVETPKEEKYFEHVHNHLIASSETIINALSNAADELGLTYDFFSKSYQNDVTSLAQEISNHQTSKQCLMGVGESTVQVTGHGKGGRNQELALRMLEQLPVESVFTACATDGYDNTDHAGAIVDSITRDKIKDPEIIHHYLSSNDSYNFFRTTDDAIITGITGTNIADFFIYLK